MIDGTPVPGLNLSLTLPANVEAEQRLVGSILLSPDLLSRLPVVEETDFTDPYCGQIWGVMLDLFRNGVVIDPATVVESLRPNFTSAPMLKDRMVDYLRSLAACPVAVHGCHHLAVLVRRLAERREMMLLSADYLREAQAVGSEDGADLRERFIGGLAGMNNRLDGFVTSHSLVQEMISDLDKPPEVDATGLEQLDEVLVGGFHRNKLYGFGGRRGAGKSNLLSTISYNMAMSNVPHAYFALESSPKQIVAGMVARHIRTNRMEFMKPQPSAWAVRQLHANADLFRKRGHHFYARPRMRLDELTGAIAKLGVRGKVKGVFVDYIQIVTGQDSRSSSVEHHDHVAQTLAELAANYDLWICAAFQLNRGGDARGGDGLMMACDAAFGIHRLDTDGREEEMWLECMKSRYFPEMHLGNEFNGAFRLNRQHGPYFEEMPR